MLDPAIQQFLDERKEGWLKKKIKSNTSDEEKAGFEQDANTMFALSSWLPDAAKRAKQLSLVSHPGKFSHPSAKVSPIIASAERKPDGYLRTGNVNAGLDVFGNAAAMDVYKFLSLVMQDGQTILAHLEAETPYITEQFDFPDTSYKEVSNGLLAIKRSDDTAVKTSGKVKQVYFPVEGDYHLLSLLTPSNLMYKLKERINVMRFSEEAKEAREARKKHQHSELKLFDIYDLSVIGFGGTKPQNISVLNSQNGGTAYLLSSLPPVLEKRKIRRPKASFFKEILWAKRYTDEFQSLHRLLVSDDKNVYMRNKRDAIVRSIVYQIVDQVWVLRRLEAGWSNAGSHQALPMAQKVLLDQQYSESRQDDERYFDEISTDLAIWLSQSYKEVVGKNKEVGLGDNQLSYFRSIVEQFEEALL
ncbi:MAG: type I-F CRISPR-associated protein Csy1 [Proteobacteria bacterium]|nr:MAG: type I-F CRISPR-associated protein Csy1 [Pseudomonadota bacterium]